LALLLLLLLLQPTCADADLDSPGQQPFDCIALGLMPIAGTEALPNPASDVCCQVRVMHLQIVLGFTCTQQMQVHCMQQPQQARCLM
jgi:hypothetical protein